MALRLSGGEQSHSFGEYVFSSVEVSIVLSTTTTEPRPIRERQVRVDSPALGAELRGREEASNLNATLEAPRGLVLDLTQELAEGRVEDRAGELGSRQSLDAQILDAEQIVLPRQVCCQFVKEVASLIRCLAMHASYPTLRFLPAVASRLLPREILLSPTKFPRTFPGELRSRNPLAIREHKQVFESKVYSNRIAGRGWLYIGHLELGGQRNVPVSRGILLERRALSLAFDFAGLANPDPTDFRNVDLSALDLDPLRNTKREVSGFLRPEPGEPTAFLEERIESPVNILQSLLKHLRIGSLEPERIGLAFERGQLGGQLLCGDAFFMLCVVALAPLKRPVVDKPARAGHAIQTSLLGLRGTHPESKDPPELHLRSCTLSFDVLLNRRLRDATRRSRKVRGGPHRGHLPKMRELLPKNPRRIALEPVDQLTNRQRRRRVDEHVQMVGLDSKMFDLDRKLFGFLPKQRFKHIRNRSDQDLASSAGYPDQVVFERDNGAFVVSIALQDRQIVSHRKERDLVVGDTCRRFILSAKAGGFLASKK